MGLFSFFNVLRPQQYVPDSNKTEYENWLDFLDQGGTSQEWNRLKEENKWTFKKDSLKEFSKYEAKFRPLFDEYISTATQIKEEWSIISNSKIYTGQRVIAFERLCKTNIEAYRKMVALENKYNKDHLQEAEGYKRLAMLYEKQGEIEKVISICKDAIDQGDIRSMPARLSRMIKKLNRVPSQEEIELIEKGV